MLSVTFSGPELIDIKNVKDRMFSENWYELGWLWIMFVSTLIPTILHLFVVLLATIQGVFSPFSQTTVNRMESAILSASSSSDINSVVHRYARFGYMFFCYGPKLLLLIIMVLVFRKIYDYRFDIYAFFDSILDVFLEVVLWL